MSTGESVGDEQRQRFAQALGDYSDVLHDQVDTMYLGCGVAGYLIPGILMSFFAWVVASMYIALAPSIGAYTGGEGASAALWFLGSTAYVVMGLTIAGTAVLLLANSAVQAACSDRTLGTYHLWLVRLFGLHGTRVSYKRRVLSVLQQHEGGPLTEAVIRSVVPDDVVGDLHEEITAAQRGESVPLERTPAPAVIERLYKTAPWFFGILLASLVALIITGPNILSHLKKH